MFASYKTIYPKIFKNSYWGNFKVKKNTSIIYDIIENRNKLVEYLKIKSRNKIPEYIKKEEKIGLLDHLECYKTKDKKKLCFNK